MPMARESESSGRSRMPTSRCRFPGSRRSACLPAVSTIFTSSRSNYWFLVQLCSLAQAGAGPGPKGTTFLALDLRTRYHLDSATAFFTDSNIDIEYPHEALCPVHRGVKVWRLAFARLTVFLAVVSFIDHSLHRSPPESSSLRRFYCPFIS